jgi:hypothetical protein
MQWRAFYYRLRETQSWLATGAQRVQPDIRFCYNLIRKLYLCFCSHVKHRAYLNGTSGVFVGFDSLGRHTLRDCRAFCNRQNGILKGVSSPERIILQDNKEYDNLVLPPDPGILEAAIERQKGSRSVGGSAHAARAGSRSVGGDLAGRLPSLEQLLGPMDVAENQKYMSRYALLTLAASTFNRLKGIIICDLPAAPRLRKNGGGAALEQAVAAAHPLIRVAAAHGLSPALAEYFEKGIAAVRKCSACGQEEKGMDGKEGSPGKLLACQKCRSALYCSKECQRAAWPEHKTICTPHIKFPTFSRDGLRDTDIRDQPKARYVADDSITGNGDSDVAESDLERQLLMLERGAAQGQQSALTAKAEMLLRVNDATGAAKILIPLADDGFTPAQCKVVAF